MVARLVRDQEVVGSSPVTSTTKKRRVLPFAFLFLRTRTHDLFPFTGLPEIAAKRDFREEEERSAHAGADPPGRREKAADRDDEGSSPVTSTTKKRRVLPFAFLFLRTRTHDLFPFTGLPEIAAKRDFREEEERSAHAGADPPGRREKAADRDDEGSSPVTSTTKKRRVLPFAFLYNERPCRRQGCNETKVKKTLTFSVVALPKRRGQERQREYRGRDLSAYR